MSESAHVIGSWAKWSKKASNDELLLELEQREHWIKHSVVLYSPSVHAIIKNELKHRKIALILKRKERNEL